MSKRSLQDLADARLAPEYRQPVKTLQEALAAIGWEEVDHPVCCGEPVEMSCMFGDAYAAVCNHCLKFLFDVTGPEFSESGSSVCFVDGDKYDLTDRKCWVSGQRPPPVHGNGE